MCEMEFLDYGVKPSWILRRHVLSGYLRILSALEWQMRDRLPIISAEADLRNQSRHPAKSKDSATSRPPRLRGRWRRFAGLLWGLLAGKYFLCLSRQVTGRSHINGLIALAFTFTGMHGRSNCEEHHLLSDLRRCKYQYVKAAQ